EYGARVSKKPITGETIYLPIRRKAAFHAGKELREMVNKQTRPVQIVREIPRRSLVETGKRVFNNVHGITVPLTAVK
ncbi:MAG: hypothetical protein IID18_01285, partial [Nitrospinae bacterium]|nr:hypothetical protein [Nitrospinota bacterium]